MKHSNRELKLYAREALKGNYSLPILSLFVLFFLSFVLNQLTLFLFHINGIFQLIIEQLFSFIISLILNVFTVGLLYMHMNIARKRVHSFGDLIYLFKNHPDRIIISTFFLSLINLITSIPYIAVTIKYSSSLLYGDNIDLSQLWQVLGLMMGTLVINLFLYMLITLPLSLTYFLLTDHTEMGAIEAFKESIRLMKGYKAKYLALQLSFIPLMLLSVLTCSIALLWIVPYMRTANVMFYLDVCGELENLGYGIIQKPQPFYQQFDPPRFIPNEQQPSHPAWSQNPGENTDTNVMTPDPLPPSRNEAGDVLSPRDDDYNSEA